MRHTGIVSEWLLVSQIVGYTVSTIVVLLLAVLVRRAAKFEDARAYGLLVCSLLLWNAGNLVASTAELMGISGDGLLVRTALRAAFTGGAMSAAGALIMWRRLGPSSVESIWLVRAAFAGGASLTLLLWGQALLGGPASEHLLWTSLAYHVATFFALGAWVFYRSHRTTRPARIGIVMAGLGALGVGLSVMLEKDVSQVASGVLVPLGKEPTGSKIVTQLSSHIMTLGALFFFARFRFADVFVRQCLRMIAAVLLGLVCAWVFAPASQVIASLTSTHTTAVALTAGVIVVAVLLLSFAAVDRVIVRFVDRWLFQQPDYELALARLRDQLAGARDRAELAAMTTRVVRDTMALQDVRVAPRAAAQQGSLPIVIPIHTSEGDGEALEVTPGWDHPTLLNREIEFLKASATVLGHRLDAVRREQDEIDRLTREADLRRQVSEATLKALQAQVNPHFLFNTLNTIADLIQEDPAGAEAMTLRLAEVFSHVLTSGHRPFSSVRQEMAFLRTYLTIEEARFGDRLRVAFAIDPTAAHAVIPSLILQPAVENALKHGLSRKIGPGLLTISAVVDGDNLQLSVEDDGVGPSARAPAGRLLRTSGVGLRNIAERLATLYADRASVCFAPAPCGGSVLTVRLPLHAHDQEPVG